MTKKKISGRLSHAIRNGEQGSCYFKDSDAKGHADSSKLSRARHPIKKSVRSDLTSKAMHIVAKK